MDKVRIAMIGCGGFQRYRVSNLLKVKDAEIVALVDTSADQVGLMKDKYPETSELPAFDDHRKMLEQIKPDAVMIATPHTQHVDQIVDALQAGAHALTEKPMVPTVADAHRVIAERDKAGKIGMVSYQRHFQPEFRYIRDRIASGEAGAVQYISVLQSQEWLRGTKGTWRQLLSLSGGGQLNDSGSHVLDIVLWTTKSSPKTVSAFCDNKGTEVDINTTLSIMFKSGAMGNIAIIGDGMNWHEEVTIWCDKEAFFVREGKLSVIDRERKRTVPEMGDGITPDQNFVDAILGKAKCESPFEAGLEVIRLTEAAWKSCADGGRPAEVSA